MNQAILSTDVRQAPASQELIDDHLPSVQQLVESHPLSAMAQARLRQQRHSISDILHGRDSRLLVVVGPCSIHDPEAAIDYGQRLASFQLRCQQQLLLVMRTYVEKPRTTVGWKGLVYDPHLDGRHDMSLGLSESRRLMVALSEIGLPLATEALSPVVADYLQDLVSWTAIGARTTESQLHREMASGLNSAVGFKNGTDGGVEVAIQAMQSAQAAHCYPTLSSTGRPQVRRTPGNANVHLVLRGGRQGPNFDEASVRRYSQILAEHNLPTRLMVDCSHDNSRKDYRNQGAVIKEVARQLSHGHSSIMGVMIESHLQQGKQSLCSGKTPEYGVSITDGCIGWEETVEVLENLMQARA